MRSVSASLTVFERFLLEAIWMVSAALAVVSITMVLLLSLRRVLRDREKKAHAVQKAEFDRAISAILSQKITVKKELLPEVGERDISPLTDILLSYLRNLSGPDADRLIEIIYAWDVEQKLRRQLWGARRGDAIEALTVLSYLNTPSSLEAISEKLHSPDPYVQLASIRCLARRDAVNMLPEIIVSVNHAGQHNRTILADVLQRFGVEAAPYLEKLVSEAVNETVRIAALEALVLIAPPATSVDFKLCLASPNERTRAAAVTLAGITGVRGGEDVLAIGTEDASALVRARSASAIKASERLDLIERLIDLISDPVWWVRYRAGRAMMSISTESRALLRSLSMQNSPQGLMAREILDEAERA